MDEVDLAILIEGDVDEASDVVVAEEGGTIAAVVDATYGYWLEPLLLSDDCCGL